MSRGRVAQAAAVIVGIALMIAPAALGYAGEAAADVHRAVGPFAASAALTALWPATASVRWVNVVLGPVMVAASVVTAPHDAVAWAVTAIATVTFVGTGAVSPETDHELGGGWAALAGGSKGPSVGTADDSSH